jgi:hypothetical protein
MTYLYITGAIMNKLYPRRVNVHMSDEMYANLRRLSTDDRKIARLIRQAIDEFIERQGDITGSRRYFIGRFKQRIDWLERLVGWHLTLLTILISEIGAILIQNLIDIPDKERQNFNGPALLRIAEQRTIESGWRVRTRLIEMIEASEDTEQQRHQ